MIGSFVYLIECFFPVFSWRRYSKQFLWQPQHFNLYEVFTMNILEKIVSLNSKQIICWTHNFCWRKTLKFLTIQKTVQKVVKVLQRMWTKWKYSVSDMYVCDIGNYANLDCVSTDSPLIKTQKRRQIITCLKTRKQPSDWLNSPQEAWLLL